MSRARIQTYQDLERALAPIEPLVAHLFTTAWNHQTDRLSLEAVKAAILTPQLWLPILGEWHAAYADMVTHRLAPHYQQAASDAAAVLRFTPDGYDVIPSAPAIHEWIATRGASLVKQITVQQRQAIQALIRDTTLLETFGVDDLARLVRPAVGLTDRQTTAVMKHAAFMREQGLSPETAQARATEYARRLHKERAWTIARTEMAAAYNQGQQAATEDLVAQGTIPPTVTRTWSTSHTERTCDLCGPLDGKTAGLHDLFPGAYAGPPIHPRCMCAVAYHIA